MIYPTKTDIMMVEQKFKPEVLAMVKDWKKAVWQDKDHMELQNRFIKLKVLAIGLSVVYNRPVNVKLEPDRKTCSYNKLSKTIIMNQSTSIISLLHEMAHHLFGPSELKACRWSVWLFKKTFPKAFQKLKWKGHMLTKI
jgi:hypothetical protein